jgi:hypothetical protein
MVGVRVIVGVTLNVGVALKLTGGETLGAYTMLNVFAHAPVGHTICTV